MEENGSFLLAPIEVEILLVIGRRLRRRPIKDSSGRSDPSLVQRLLKGESEGIALIIDID